MCHGYNHCALIGFRWGIGITICNGILGIVRFEKEKWENLEKKFFLAMKQYNDHKNIFILNKILDSLSYIITGIIKILIMYY